MNKFLLLPTDRRLTIYEQVSLRLGIDNPKAIDYKKISKLEKEVFLKELEKKELN